MINQVFSKNLKHKITRHFDLTSKILYKSQINAGKVSTEETNGHIGLVNTCLRPDFYSYIGKNPYKA